MASQNIPQAIPLAPLDVLVDIEDPHEAQENREASNEPLRNLYEGAD
jgi:hypothetical protein